ncbi:DNA polymerase sliding clamp subunit [Pyrodictium delaneyi]|uniref:DNA polymerase sliding clamp n=1 Tax=Pyrodictium delaneyi TaxID=1273541 RepID=A0A0P0N464_9CREN|nr:DNA polymerase sliding clamp [Pyrodictium delaneyi]ALL01087.1 DNA polymerase sliding clamp subunit [Pyrodictium delaneyi]OWJ55330.1 DNA polymerase sliding clamp [Pyrodictium delaneyi]
MGFRAVYPAATKFKYIIQTIAKVMDEIPFIATQDGIDVRTLTPDKTTMIILRLPMVAFEEYELDEDKKTFIVPADELNRIAKRGTRNDLVELKLDEERRRLEVNFIDKKTGVVRSFYVPLREGVVEEFSEPQVELTVTARMMADDFKNIINDAKIVSDEVEFSSYEDRIEVYAESAQKRYMGVLRVGEPLISLDVTGNTPVKAKYSIDLLKASVKATTAADTVTVQYGEALPMRISFDLPSGGTLIYWVSPRI